jgi:selenocysteine-specific elongation factor
LPELKAELARLSGRVQGRHTDLPFRFPVDRSFTLKGFGTIVTGTVLAGRLAKDEEAVQYPAGRRVRIRGLQTHGRSVDSVEAGQRAAINLAGIEKEDIQRGDQLAAPDSLLTSFLLNVELKLLEDAPKDLTQRSRARMHLGTREVIGRIVLLEGERFEAGQTQLIQVRLEQPVSTRHGDRFIVRNYSPLFTLGGGRVIDPAPSKSRRVRAELATRLKALAGDEPEALVEQAIWLQAARGVRANEGSIRTGLSARAFVRAVEKLSSQGQAVNVDPGDNPRFVHAQALERVASFLERVLETYHKSFPEREGMSRAELAGKLSLLFSEKEVGTILQRLVKQGRAFQNGQAYARTGHAKSLTGQQEDSLTRLIGAIRAGGVMAPRRTHLFEAARLDEKTGQQALNLGTHNRRLVRVKDDLYYIPEVLAGIEQQLRDYLKERQQITVIDFKDLIGVTRKHAVDLLEHFDAERVTLRLDNHRVLRQG